MQKQERQQYIQTIIEQQVISRQAELVAALQAAGVEVTQATISRDIKEMKLSKVVGENGVAHYQMPNPVSEPNPVNQAAVPVPEINGGDLIKVKSQGQFIAVETVPGYGPMVAMILRKGEFPEVFTAVGDDANVFVVCTDPEAASQLAQRLLAIV